MLFNEEIVLQQLIHELHSHSTNQVTLIDEDENKDKVKEKDIQLSDL